jgi:hypothetical protein
VITYHSVGSYVSNDWSILVRPNYLAGDLSRKLACQHPNNHSMFDRARPGFASNLELKVCKVDPGVHRLLAYLVLAISNGGGLDLEVVPSKQRRRHCCEEV